MTTERLARIFAGSFVLLEGILKRLGVAAPRHADGANPACRSLAGLRS